MKQTLRLTNLVLLALSTAACARARQPRAPTPTKAPPPEALPSLTAKARSSRR